MRLVTASRHASITPQRTASGWLYQHHLDQMEHQKPLGSVDWIAIPSCINDDTLGPFVRGCRDDFDFTLFFEHVILSIVPATIFIIAASARFLHLLGKKKVATAYRFQWLKIVSRPARALCPVLF